MMAIPALRRPRCLFRRLARDRRGVAAVEFVVLAPFLLLLYLAAAEVAQAIETNRKLASAASTIGGLVAQQPTVTADEIDAIMQVAKAILQPYARSGATIHVTAIRIPDQGEPEVAWSRKLVDGVGSADSAVKTAVVVPERLDLPGTFLIHAEARLAYRPILAFTADQRTSLGLLDIVDNIEMREGFYHRPRQSADISCNDC